MQIIGFGIATRKTKDEKIIYPDEFLFNKAIWKYKVEFDIYFSMDKLEYGIPLPDNIMVNTGRRVINKERFLHLVHEAEHKWNISLFALVH